MTDRFVVTPLYESFARFDPPIVVGLELVAAAVSGLGLDSLGPFNPSERIIEYAVR